MMKNCIRICTINDLDTLQKIASKTYNETFNHLNTAICMEDYLKEAFDIEKLGQEMINKHSAFYFIYVDEQLAGYMKVNDYKAQTDLQDRQSLEIERIYVLRAYHSQGLGQILINKGIEIAGQMQKAYVWLGVWEKNTKAIGFYTKNGFEVVGNHSFFMGNEEQNDLIMRKSLIEY